MKSELNDDNMSWTWDENDEFSISKSISFQFHLWLLNFIIQLSDWFDEHHSIIHQDDFHYVEFQLTLRLLNDEFQISDWLDDEIGLKCGVENDDDFAAVG